MIVFGIGRRHRFRGRAGGELLRVVLVDRHDPVIGELDRLGVERRAVVERDALL